MVCSLKCFSSNVLETLNIISCLQFLTLTHSKKIVEPAASNKSVRPEKLNMRHGRREIHIWVVSCTSGLVYLIVFPSGPLIATETQRVNTLKNSLWSFSFDET